MSDLNGTEHCWQRTINKKQRLQNIITKTTNRGQQNLRVVSVVKPSCSINRKPRLQNTITKTTNRGQGNLRVVSVVKQSCSIKQKQRLQNIITMTTNRGQQNLRVLSVVKQTCSMDTQHKYKIARKNTQIRWQNKQNTYTSNRPYSVIFFIPQ